MDLNAFTDELLRLKPVGLTKQAGLIRAKPVDRLYSRMLAAGGLAGLGGHALESAKGGVTANPYDGPKGDSISAIKKGALGGLLAALGLKVVGRMAKRH